MLIQENKTDKAIVRIHDDSVQADATEEIMRQIAERALETFQREESRKAGQIA